MHTTLSRDSYGALYSIYNTSETDRNLYLSAMVLVQRAAQKKLIPASYDNISWDRKGRSDGDAVHHELYDIYPDGRHVLVCVREAEGSKYGVKTLSKDYFLISKKGRGIVAVEASKAVAAKAAKSCGQTIGGAIVIVSGRGKLPSPIAEKRTGYKLVAQSDNGFVSVWDGSPWRIGKTRTERATPDHDGGFYYYATIDEALEAAAHNDVFGTAREHKKLVVVEVEASGKHYTHSATYGTKLCASRIRPIREVAMTI